MERALRQTVVIGPGGSFEGKAPGLAAGTVAEIIFLFPEPDLDNEKEEAATRQNWLEKAWAISDKAIAEGMETWDLDRINAEVQARRHGDRGTS